MFGRLRAITTRLFTPLAVVPRFIVQHSRKTLLSPISRRVGSPLYFLSCGAPPSEEMR